MQTAMVASNAIEGPTMSLHATISTMLGSEKVKDIKGHVSQALMISCNEILDLYGVTTAEDNVATSDPAMLTAPEEDDDAVSVAAHEIRELLVSQQAGQSLVLRITTRFCRDTSVFINSIVADHKPFFELADPTRPPRSSFDHLQLLKMILITMLTNDLDDVEKLGTGAHSSNVAASNLASSSLLSSLRLLALCFHYIQEQWTQQDNALLLRVIRLYRIPSTLQELDSSTLDVQTSLLSTHESQRILFSVLLIMGCSISQNHSTVFNGTMIYFFQGGYFLPEGFLACIYFKSMLIKKVFVLVDSMLGSSEVKIPSASLQVARSLVSRSSFASNSNFVGRVLDYTPEAPTTRVEVLKAINFFINQGTLRSGKKLWKWFTNSISALESRAAQGYVAGYDESVGNMREFYDAIESMVRFSYVMPRHGVLMHCMNDYELAKLLSKKIENTSYSSVPGSAESNRRSIDIVVRSMHLLFALLCQAAALKTGGKVGKLTEYQLSQLNNDDTEDKSFMEESSAVEIPLIPATTDTAMDDSRSNSDSSGDSWSSAEGSGSDDSISSNGDAAEQENVGRKSKARNEEEEFIVAVDKSKSILRSGYARVLNGLPLKRYHMELLESGLFPMLATRIGALLYQLYPENVDLMVTNIVELQLAPRSSGSIWVGSSDRQLNVKEDPKASRAILRYDLVKGFWNELGYKDVSVSLLGEKSEPIPEFIKRISERTKLQVRVLETLAVNAARRGITKEEEKQRARIVKFLSSIREYLESVLLNKGLELAAEPHIVSTCIDVYIGWVNADQFRDNKAQNHEHWADGWDMLWVYAFYCSPQETLIFTLSRICSYKKSIAHNSSGGGWSSKFLFDWERLVNSSRRDNSSIDSILYLEALNVFAWTPHVIFEEFGLLARIPSHFFDSPGHMKSGAIERSEHSGVSLFRTIFMPCLRFVTVASRNRMKSSYSKFVCLSSITEDKTKQDELDTSNDIPDNTAPSAANVEADSPTGLYVSESESRLDLTDMFASITKGSARKTKFQPSSLEAMLLLQEASLVQLLLDTISKAIPPFEPIEANAKDLPLQLLLMLDPDGGDYLKCMHADTKESIIAACQYLHNAFIENPVLLKLVCFQGMPLNIVKLLVSQVASMHIVFEYISELISFGIGSRRLLRYVLTLAVELCYKYPLQKTVEAMSAVWDCVMQVLNPVTMLSDRMIKVFNQKSMLEKFADISDSRQRGSLIKIEVDRFKENYHMVNQNSALHVAVLNLFPTIAIIFPDPYLNLCKQYLENMVPRINKVDPVLRTLLIQIPGFVEFVQMHEKIEKLVIGILDSQIYSDPNLVNKSLR